MKLEYLKSSQLNLLPEQPGTYIFYAAKKSPLYIGKATNLRERVKNHFQQPTYKDNLFINKVKKIGFIPLESDIEALILESQLIKKYQPKFNILFRDDKKYFYVGITNEDWPRVFITHQPCLKTYKLKNLKTDYIGPFTDGGALKQTLKILRKIFPYRTCKVLPKRPCLWYQLSRCPAPCLIEKESKIRRILKKETDVRKKGYKKDIRKFKSILKGERERLALTLEKEMKKMAKLEEFERAERIKEQIESLKRIFSHKRILTEVLQRKNRRENIGVLLKEVLGLPKTPQRIEGYDISNIKAKEMVGSMVVLKLSRICTNEYTNFCEYKYTPDKSQYRKFKIKTVKRQNDIACLKEIIKRRLFHKEWKLPDLIFVDGGKAQLNAAKEVIDSNWKERLKPSIISLAKKKNLLYNINSRNPFLLDKLPKEVKMTILHLRDESHRFAIFYHKILREKHLFSL